MTEERPVVTLTRRNGDPAGPTLGDLKCGDFWLATLERPRTGDHPCIPHGEYDVDWTENEHPKHPFCYEVRSVKGRTDILIHAANVIEQLQGCIAPGMSVAVFKRGAIRTDLPSSDQNGVTASKTALGMLHDKLCRKNFRLVIREII